MNSKVWRDYVENILVAVILALIVRSFLVAGYRVPTGSMSPTLLPGDFIFAYKVPFGLKIPFVQKKIPGPGARRGDVVVFSYPDQPQVTYVKRVIGLPGDLIQIENGFLRVNGERLKIEQIPPAANDELSEAYQVLKEQAPEGSRQILRLKAQVDSKQGQNFGPLVVPPDEVFLMGDHRDLSDDSRYWGTVPSSRIEGRVVMIWLSFRWSDRSKIPSLRWNRLFTSP